MNSCTTLQTDLYTNKTTTKTHIIIKIHMYQTTTSGGTQTIIYPKCWHKEKYEPAMVVRKCLTGHQAQPKSRVPTLDSHLQLLLFASEKVEQQQPVLATGVASQVYWMEPHCVSVLHSTTYLQNNNSFYSFQLALKVPSFCFGYFRRLGFHNSLQKAGIVEGWVWVVLDDLIKDLTWDGVP